MMTSSPIPDLRIGALTPQREPGRTLPAGRTAVGAEIPASTRTLTLDPTAEVQPDLPVPTDREDRDTLFVDFAPLIRRLIRQYASDDPEMREDMRGELFCRFSQLYDEYDSSRGIPLRPYLVRKLTAAAYTFARHHWRRDRREMSLEFGEEYGDPGPSADPTASWDHALALENVLNLLPEGITQLPTRQRQLVIWRYYEQRSFEEIAERLDIRVATARSILRHGLNNLRKWIQKEKLDWEA